MSERNSTCSSVSPSGTFSGPTSANGTRAYSRLAAGVAAGHVRVAEEAGRRVAVQLLRHPRVRVRVVAQRPELLLAEEAAAARDRERHDDAVADLQLGVLLADLDDFAHELVAEDVARLHRRDEAVVEMEIGAADRACVVILTIASRGLRIFGSGTRSTRTSLVACQTSAFISSPGHAEAPQLRRGFISRS